MRDTKYEIGEKRKDIITKKSEIVFNTSDMKYGTYRVICKG